jgi:hypothetical protein
MTKPEPRDVIARAVNPYKWDSPFKWRPVPDDAIIERHDELLADADAILAALDQAGYVIVPKKVARAGELIRDVVPGFKRMTDPEPGKD